MEILSGTEMRSDFSLNNLNKNEQDEEVVSTLLYCEGYKGQIETFERRAAVKNMFTTVLLYLYFIGRNDPKSDRFNGTDL